MEQKAEQVLFEELSASRHSEYGSNIDYSFSNSHFEVIDQASAPENTETTYCRLNIDQYFKEMNHHNLSSNMMFGIQSVDVSMESNVDQVKLSNDEWSSDTASNSLDARSIHVNTIWIKYWFVHEKRNHRSSPTAYSSPCSSYCYIFNNINTTILRVLLSNIHQTGRSLNKLLSLIVSCIFNFSWNYV